MRLTIAAADIQAHGVDNGLQSNSRAIYASDNVDSGVESNWSDEDEFGELSEDEPASSAMATIGATGSQGTDSRTQPLTLGSAPSGILVITTNNAVGHGVENVLDRKSVRFSERQEVNHLEKALNTPNQGSDDDEDGNTGFGSNSAD